MENPVLAISYFVHLIATVFWIGWLFLFVLFLLPHLQRAIPEPQVSQQLTFQLQKRFRPFANLSLLVLLGTGMVQMSADDHYEGLLEIAANTWSVAMFVKHVAFTAMAVIAGWIQFGLAPALERANLLASKGKPSDLQKLLDREHLFTRIMGILGIVVLICTAIATAI